MLGLSYRVLLTGVALCLSNPVYAQSWPQRPVSVVVPQPAGNSPDVLCRVIADKLSRALGQQFVVENRAGAANLVGTQSVARAAPGRAVPFPFRYDRLYRMQVLCGGLQRAERQSRGDQLAARR